MDRHEVRTVLRGWFAQWGLPAQLRIDNGAPWGSWSGLPPELALWVIGMGVAMIGNRPRHSQGNAVIERAHGVCQRWVEPDRGPSPTGLQARLDWAMAGSRDPAIAGQSRLAAYPGLATGGRPYDTAQENACWDVRRVWAFWGEQVWTRRVDKVGRLSLANRPVAVGRPWAGQEVTLRRVVHDDAPVWVIRDAQGRLLRQHPAPELSRERILALDVSHRRPKRRRPRVKHRVHHAA